MNICITCFSLNEPSNPLLYYFYMFYIVFVCMIINCCFDVVFYINMCIAHAKIFIYFTPGNHFTIVGFFV